ncbi:MAG: cupin domain-containing protein [Bacteroidota bacterium]
MEVINLEQKFSSFTDQWSPKVIGQLNGQDVKLAKLEGEFVWHDHKHEDEMFLILKGSLDIEFREGTKTLKAGEMIIVPRGVAHKPIAKEEVWIMLFEPANIKHTGEVEHEITVKTFEKI